MPITRRPNRRFFELIGYDPFPIQLEIHASKAHMRVVCVGRQVGKSEAGAVEAAFELVANPGCVGWVIAPTYDQAEIIFNRTVEKLERIAEQLPHLEIHLQRRRLRVSLKHHEKAPPTPGKFPPDWKPLAVSEFRGKSADRPDNLKGATLDFAILDEAAMMDKSVWGEAIQPMLSTKKGWALLISTPRGWNWFYRFFRLGWKGKEVPEDYAEQFGNLGVTTPETSSPNELESGFESFHAASWEVREDVGVLWYENAKAGQTDLEFRQEYGAEFISHSGSVFTSLDNVIRLPYKSDAAGRWIVQKPRKDREYYIGADFGKNQDWSVFTVLDPETGQIVAMQRTNETSWQIQRRQLSKLAIEYNDAAVVADTWGIGEVLAEDLIRDGIRLIEAPIKSLVVKEDYINHLNLLMQHGEVYLPDNEVIFAELRNFHYHRTPSGKTSMRAYGRGHDDIVISLALAYHLYEGGGTPDFKPEDFTDIADAQSLAESYSDWAGFDINSEFDEANRMFA